MIRVPTGFPSIQEAIDSSTDGDVVVLDEGTYRENIDFAGKNIRIASMFAFTGERDAISGTVIDGAGNGTVVSFQSGEGPGAVLSGLVIANGDAQKGGGIFIANAAPTVENCIVKDNVAVLSGGGVYIDGQAPIFRSCSIKNNEAGEKGGGVYLDGSASRLSNCLFVKNRAAEGGAVYLTEAAPTFVNCTVSNNSASAKGGAVSGTNSSSKVENCIFSNNNAPAYPEILMEGGAPQIEYSNVAGGFPGTGNMGSTPNFADPENEDYRLLPESPCIDAGNPVGMAVDPFDFEGDVRILDGDRNGNAVVDMGFDEFVGQDVRVAISVFLQGGGRPDSGWVVPLAVQLLDSDSGERIFEATEYTIKNGDVATVLIEGVLPGIYDIVAASDHTLANVKRDVRIAAPVTIVNMCVLREGNSDGNDFVDIDDFSLFVEHFMTNCDDQGYNPLADFDRNCLVDIDDFTFIVENFMVESPVDCQ